MSRRIETPERPMPETPRDRGDWHDRQAHYDPGREDVYQQEIEQTENADDDDS